MASKKIEDLEKKRKELDARIKLLKAQEQTKQRKLDTRKKVLLGAMLMQWMSEDEKTKQRVAERLNKFLTRKMDRDLFGLPPLPEKTKS